MSDDIDFGLDLGLPEEQKDGVPGDEKVTRGPWGAGEEIEAKIKAANGELPPPKKKSVSERLGELEGKVKERVAARMLAQIEEVLGDGEEMPLEDRLAELATIAKNYQQRPN